MTFALPIVDQPPPALSPTGDAFDDWRWQLRNRITAKDDIAARLPLTPEEEAGLDAAPGHFRVADHALLLLAHRSRAPVVPGAHAGDPARARARRSSRAIWSIRWARTAIRPPPASSTAIPIAACCSRSTAARSTAGTATGAAWSGRRNRRSRAQELDARARLHPAHARPSATCSISGGDPLTLSTDAARGDHRRACARSRTSRSSASARACRSCCRCASTTSCARCCRSYHPLYVNTHFNHPKELTPRGARRLREARRRRHPARQPDGAAARRELVGARAAQAVHGAAALSRAPVLPVPGRRRGGHVPPAHLRRDRDRADAGAARAHLRPGDSAPRDRHAGRHGQGVDRPRLRRRARRRQVDAAQL